MFGPHNFSERPSKNNPLRVLLADNESKVRSALRLFLEYEEGVSIIDEVADGNELLTILHKVCPNLLLLDWELPGAPMNEVLPYLRSLGKQIKIIALSGLPEAEEEAIRAGVDAFISKGKSPQHFLACFHALARL